jgi:hypothetical protein
MPGVRLPQRRPRDDDEESDEGSESSKRARLTPDVEEDADTVSEHTF